MIIIQIIIIIIISLLKYVMFGHTVSNLAQKKNILSYTVEYKIS